MPSIDLPFALDSNMVFASDGRHLFLRSAAGELWSVDVPRATDAPLPAPRLELSAAEGTVLAAGWFEGRLAVVRIVGDDVVASHGIMGHDFATSRPLRARGVADRFVQKDSHHLDPYVVWWGGIGEMDERGIALTLVPSRDGLALLGHDGSGEPVPLRIVAEAVRWVAPLGVDGLGTIVIGKLPSPATKAGERAPRVDSLTERLAILEFTRRGLWRPIRHARLDNEPVGSVLAGCGGGAIGSFGVVSYERRPGEWKILWEGGACDRRVSAGVDVVGAVGHGADASLLVRSADARALYLAGAGEEARGLVQPAAPIEAIACSLAEPRIAWLSAGRLHVVALR